MFKVFCLVLTLGVISCQNRSTNESGNEGASTLDTVSTSSEPELGYSDSIKSVMREFLMNLHQSDSISIGDTLTLDYRFKDSFEIITFLTKRSETFEVQETFGLSNDNLIYAFEQQVFYYEGERTTPWNCEYFIQDDTIIDHVSLGMGETESDEWEPESIFEQWEAKRKFYEQIKAIANKR